MLPCSSTNLIRKKSFPYIFSALFYHDVMLIGKFWDSKTFWSWTSPIRNINCRTLQSLTALNWSKIPLFIRQEGLAVSWDRWSQSTLSRDISLWPIFMLFSPPFLAYVSQSLVFRLNFCKPTHGLIFMKIQNEFPGHPLSRSNKQKPKQFSAMQPRDYHISSLHSLQRTLLSSELTHTTRLCDNAIMMSVFYSLA
jgi:hypothetical protein